MTGTPAHEHRRKSTFWSPAAPATSGSVLVPKLLAAGHRVSVLDLYLYGDDVLDAVKDHPNLEQIKGDMRDQRPARTVVPGCDAVIHLACISNDPSFELDPGLGKSINYDAFLPLVADRKDSGVTRFIYASSSSVYGIKDEENVTEELPLEPLTDYSKFKAHVRGRPAASSGRRASRRSILRPATVCGYSPRLRLDLTVNILTNHAVNNRRDQGLRRRAAAAEHPHRGHDRPLRPVARVAGRADRRQGLQRRLPEPHGLPRSPSMVRDVGRARTSRS